MGTPSQQHREEEARRTTLGGHGRGWLQEEEVL